MNRTCSTDGKDEKCIQHFGIETLRSCRHSWEGKNVKFTLEQAKKAQRESGGTALLFV
jgi:hypothetical protein